MTPYSEPDKTPIEGYVPWTPPGAPPATRMQDAVRPLALIVGGALVVALLVAWMSSRKQEAEPLPSVLAGGGMDGGVPASLLIDSEPVGATVWVSGDSVGVTPMWLSEVTPGVVEVVLRSDRGAHDTTLALKPGQDASVLIWLEDMVEEPRQRSQDIAERLERPERTRTEPASARPPAEPQAETRPTPAREASPVGRLQITTVPEGASVWIARERVGITPLTLDAIPPGEQIVELRTPGYEPERLRLDIAANVLTTESIELRPRPGIVTITAEAGARVFVNGTLEGTIRGAPLRLALATGRHEVRVFHPEQGEGFKVIEVAAGTAQRLAFDRPEATSEDSPARGTERRRTGW